MENPTQENPNIVPQTPAPIQPPPTSGSGKRKWLWILLGILILLGLLWATFSLFSKNKNTHPGNSTNNQTNNNSSGACKAISQTALDLFIGAGLSDPNVKWTATDKYPQEFPADFPKYSNAKVLGYTSANDPKITGRKVIFTQACTSDNITEVNKYFESITLAKTGWQSQKEALLQSNPNISTATLQQIQAQLDTQPFKTFIKGGVSANVDPKNVDPKKVVFVTIDAEESGTKILYMTWYQ
jgi:hypothetical protein